VKWNEDSFGGMHAELGTGAWVVIASVKGEGSFDAT
jgi:hypothetical protein